MRTRTSALWCFIVHRLAGHWYRVSPDMWWVCDKCGGHWESWRDFE